MKKYTRYEVEEKVRRMFSSYAEHSKETHRQGMLKDL